MPQVQSACEPIQKENARFPIKQIGHLGYASDLPLVTEGGNQGGETADEVCTPQYLGLCGVLDAVQLCI